MVWHHNTDEEELNKVLTDSTGKTHIFSLGVGKIRPEVKLEQRTVAAAILPPPVDELFQKIESPSTQAVTDSLTSTATFIDCRVLRVGDAVAGLRAHATAGTSQEAMRALLLKNVFENDASMKISDWDQKVLEWDTFAPKFGIQNSDGRLESVWGSTSSRKWLSHKVMCSKCWKRTLW
jgi:hypothetical protein